MGHADFFRGLMEAAGFNEEAAEELRELIANKNYFGVEEIVSKFDMAQDLRELFAMLCSAYCSMEELGKARALSVNYPKILSAIVRLEELHKALKPYGIGKYVSYELDMISDYQYYTGIVFAGYTFGSGEAVLKGGRYDKLLQYFGKQAASIGFAVVADQLMAALSRQKIAIPVPCAGELILYSKEQYGQAALLAMELRKSGKAAELLCKDGAHTTEEYERYAKQKHFEKITVLEGEKDE